MKENKQLKWLQDEIETLVRRYRLESSLYKRKAFRLKIVSVFLAAIITVLLGLKLGESSLTEVFSNIALILSAAITVLSAYEAFFDPRALWVRETVTFVRLKDLQRDLNFWKEGLDPETDEAEMVGKCKSRLDSILEDTLK